MSNRIFLFLDDLRDPPPGFVLCRTAGEAIERLRTGTVAMISFDHDLGVGPTGHDVAKFIEAWVAAGEIPMPDWTIHSANPVGRANIEATMQAARRLNKGSG